MKKVMTVSIVHQDSRVLLGMKKRGLGEGRWNGFGGKVKSSETILEAAKRELFEEAGIKATDIEKFGISKCRFENEKDILEVHFFKVRDFQEEPKETNEMKPKWFLESEIPYDEMWPDDKLWMPLFLKNKKFKGKFLFDLPSDSKYSSKIIEKNIKEVENLNA